MKKLRQELQKGIGTNKLRKKGLRTKDNFKIDRVNYINAKKQASRLVNLALEREKTLAIETIIKQGESWD